MVTGRRNIGSQAPSGDLRIQVDALQEETQQGPWLDVAYDHLTVRVADKATETRWPEAARPRIRWPHPPCTLGLVWIRTYLG